MTLVDQRGAISETLEEKAKALNVALHRGATAINVLGGKRVTGVVIGDVSDRSQPHKVDCELVCMSGGWSPVIHLTSHTGIKPQYVREIDAFVPGGYAKGHFGAGALTGRFAVASAIREGIEAGRSAAATSGHDVRVSALPPPSVDDTACEVIDPVPLLANSRRGKAFIDFQNDVTLKDLAIAHQEGYQSVEHLKRYTTLGMGTDQGKTSNLNALAIEAQLSSVEIPAVGTTTFRPPFTPVAFGALAGRSIGNHFRPTRRSPLHDWHVTHGGELIQAGPWMRAWWYRWAGTTAEIAYIEEMRLVRSGVGLADASTLGKIDVQGPDAAEFLNRIYSNDFSTLKVGKARYGVMLADDGTVFDDGSTTRLAQTRYFMTTTTAQAGEVMSWIEFLLQTAWTDLNVHVTSLTDEWAAMAVAGPKARAALELAFPGQDLSDAKLPYMGCLEIEVDGVPLRLIRLSFSGELAFEVYVPADYAVALWEHIFSRASPLGIKPFGLEAVASLRIEKGHVAGLELDHRNTLDDLDLAKMAGKGKAYVGRELRQRPRLTAPERWSLVGIECLDPGKPLRGGSILFASGDKIEGHGRGYITSVTWSTELNKFIALGLYKGGLKHSGEIVVCAFPLKGEQVKARIVNRCSLIRKGSASVFRSEIRRRRGD